MNFSLIFLVHRLLYRIYAFLKHWYVGGFMTIARRTVGILESLDQVLAVKITARYFFKPLYQDYSILGYILGFVFRSIRLFTGGLVYLLITLTAVAIYLIWAGLPLYVIYKGFWKI
jgi:hypothetical protein